MRDIHKDHKNYEVLPFVTHSQVWTHHEQRKGESLAHFATAACLFLRAFPSETLLMYVSHEVRCSRQDVYDAISAQLGTKFLVHKFLFVPSELLHLKD